MSLKRFIIFFSVLYLVILLFFGIFYEDMTDVFINVMSRGFFTAHPITIFNNYGAHFLLNHLYKNLNSVYAIGWYGILNLLFQFLSIVNTLVLIYTILQPDKNKFNWILILVFLAYISDDIIFLQYTKSAIFLISSSILNILWHEIKDKPIGKRKLIINIIFFFTGLLIRPQAFYLSLLVLLPFALIYGKTILSNINLKKSAGFASVLFLTLIIIFSYSKSYTETDRQYAAFSQYSSSIWDGKQPINTLHLNNRSDSTIYFSFLQYFFPDTINISPEIMKKIGIYKRHYAYEFFKVAVKEIRFKIDLAKKLIIKLYEQTKSRLFLLFSILLLLIYAATKNRYLFLKVLFQLTSTFLILCFITVIAKMENRILFPLFFFSILCSLFYFPVFHFRKGILNNFLTGWVLFFSIISIYYNSFHFSDRIKGQQEINSYLNELDNVKEKPVYILDLFSLNILCNNVLQSSLHINKEEWFCYDAGYHIFFDEYKEKRRKLTHAGSFRESILNLKSNSKGFVFICTPERIKLLQDYLMSIYSIPINFKKTNTESLFKYPIFGATMTINTYIVEN